MNQMQKDHDKKLAELDKAWVHFCSSLNLSEQKSLVQKHQTLSLKRIELKVSIESNIQKIENHKRNLNIYEELGEGVKKLEDILSRSSQVVNAMRQPVFVKELALSYSERKKLDDLQQTLNSKLKRSSKIS
jgi:hypothetical protein